MTINEKIEFVRKESGFTQKKFAETLGLTPSFYASIKKGESQFPRQKLPLLVEHFFVSLNWLLADRGAVFVNHSYKYDEYGMVKENLFLIQLIIEYFEDFIIQNKVKLSSKEKAECILELYYTFVWQKIEFLGEHPLMGFHISHYDISEEYYKIKERKKDMKKYTKSFNEMLEKLEKKGLY